MILSASMMCCSFEELRVEVQKLNDAGIDMFHCDIMDGGFVPNMAMGLNDVLAIRKHTDRPIDVHLMINDPAKIVDLFIDLNINIIYIHPETDPRAIETLMHIADRGVIPALAISPEVSFEMVKELLPYVDYVLIMCVIPGFSGQNFLENLHRKIETFIKKKKTYHYKIILDGAITDRKIRTYTRMGADGFVLGTSALFNQSKGYHEVIHDNKQIDNE